MTDQPTTVKDKVASILETEGRGCRKDITEQIGCGDSAVRKALKALLQEGLARETQPGIYEWAGQSVRKSERKSTRSIRQAIFELFEQKGSAQVTLEEAAQVAKSIKPDTAFKASHLNWYRAKYNQRM